MLKLLEISEICDIIQKLNSYNLMTKEMAEKAHWKVYKLDEKI